MASRPGISRCRDDAGRFTTSILPDQPHSLASPHPQSALGPVTPTSPTSMVALNLILNLKSVQHCLRDRLSTESILHHLPTWRRALPLLAQWSLHPRRLIILIKAKPAQLAAFIVQSIFHHPNLARLPGRLHLLALHLQRHLQHLANNLPGIHSSRRLRPRWRSSPHKFQRSTPSCSSRRPRCGIACCSSFSTRIAAARFRAAPA